MPYSCIKLHSVLLVIQTVLYMQCLASVTNLKDRTGALD